MKKYFCCIFVSAILAAVFPARSFAWFHSEPPQIGSVDSTLPSGYTTVKVGGTLYYYAHGVYYSKAGNKNMVIRPPVGAVVPHIPSYYKKVVISGASYYTFHNTYYLHTAEGYRVVPAPR